MKKLTLLTLLVIAAINTSFAQVARSFTVNITADGESWMKVYMPKNPTGRAIVDCPGGGYSGLAMEHEGHDWAAYFNERGIIFGVLKYRMPKGDREIPMSDAQAAVRMMRDSASVWGVNPNDVGIMGFSAGGHLASTTATHAPLISRPDFQILFYPVISMNESESHKGSCVNFLGDDRSNEKLVKEFSNYNKISKRTTPPGIILMSQVDGAVPPLTNGIAYFNAMTQKNVPCTIHVYPDGGHGWGFRESFSFHYNMLNDLSTWLSQLKTTKKDAIRVACIGNSITDGHGIRLEKDTYPSQLQRILGSDYLVKNFGVSGRTMLNNGNRPYMKENAWKDAQDFCPDIVVIKLGTNDSKPMNWDTHSKEYAADMQQMIDALKALPSSPKIYLCTPIAGNHQATGDNPQNQCRDKVIREEVIPQILKVAKKNKLQVIDLYPVVSLDEKDMQKDMLHPTAAGAGKIAKAVANAIK